MNHDVMAWISHYCGHMIIMIHDYRYIECDSHGDSLSWMWLYSEEIMTEEFIHTRITITCLTFIGSLLNPCSGEYDRICLVYQTQVIFVSNHRENGSLYIIWLHGNLHGVCGQVVLWHRADNTPCMTESDDGCNCKTLGHYTYLRCTGHWQHVIIVMGAWCRSVGIIPRAFAPWRWSSRRNGMGGHWSSLIYHPVLKVCTH